MGEIVVPEDVVGIKGLREQVIDGAGRNRLNFIEDALDLPDEICLFIVECR